MSVLVAPEENNSPNFNIRFVIPDKNEVEKHLSRPSPLFAEEELILSNLKNEWNNYYSNFFINGKWFDPYLEEEWKNKETGTYGYVGFLIATKLN